MRAAWMVGAAIVVVAPAVAWADDVPALIKLVEEPPAGMDHAAWKEKRREAAKKLVASGDKRAVPVLMKVAESETFDIIGEIAIDGLGTIGDSQAVPVLQRIEADPSRDRGQRDKARKALAKLGAKPSDGAAPESGATSGGGGGAGAVGSAGAGAGSAGGGKDLGAEASGGAGGAGGGAASGGTGGGTSTSGSIGSVLLGDGNRAIPDGPTFDPAILASVERITFAVGGAHLGYDSVRKRSSFDADLTASYERRVDKDNLAWAYGGSGHVLAGYINPDGPSSSRGAQIDLRGRGEVRAYFGPGAYALAGLEGLHQTF
jgi:HEAT repeats